MRVVAVSDARGTGGAEISLANLLAALPRTVDVRVVAADDAVARRLLADRPDLDAVVEPRPPARAAAVARLARAAPAVVHLNLCTPWACAAETAAALAVPGARVVAVQQLPLRTAALPRLLRTRALLTRLDAHVAVGLASCRRVEDFYALGRGSTTSVPNLVPDRPDGVRAPHPHDAPPAGPLRVVSLARLDAVKGVDVLVDALARTPGVEVTVLGEGADRGALEVRAARAGVVDRLHLPGWREDPRACLADFDAFTLASRSEGFPLSVVEAMLARLPVVATDVGSTSEALAGAGLLVPPGDASAVAAAWVRLRDEPGLARRLADAARERAAADLTVERMAARYQDLWRQVLAAPARPRLRVGRLRD